MGVNMTSEALATRLPNQDAARVRAAAEARGERVAPFLAQLITKALRNEEQGREPAS
jgi:hypothetical protein